MLPRRDISSGSFAARVQSSIFALLQRAKRDGNTPGGADKELRSKSGFVEGFSTAQVWSSKTKCGPYHAVCFELMVEGEQEVGSVTFVGSNA